MDPAVRPAIAMVDKVSVLNTTTEIMQHSDIIASFFSLGERRCANCKLRMLM
jgi:hypothetical protein